jgi:hypothetical protein
MNRKLLSVGSLALALATCATGSLLAQTGTAPTISNPIDWSNLQKEITDALGPAILIGIGVGLTILVVQVCFNAVRRNSR